MKFATIALALLSVSAFAQTQPTQPTEHPCQDFYQERAQAQTQFQGINEDFSRLTGKREAIQARLQQKMDQMAPLLNQRDSLTQEISTLSNSQAGLQSQLQTIQYQRNTLLQQIRMKDQDRLAHIQMANNTTNIQVKREHLHASKILEKEIADLNQSVLPLDQQMAQVQNQMQNLPMQIQQRNQMLSNVNAQIAAVDTNPTLAVLQNQILGVNQEIAQKQGQFDLASQMMAKAESRVNMCEGYLVLSVKYPTALKLSRKVMLKGCSRYVPVEQGNQIANQAQAELVNSMCNRPQ